MIEDQSPSIPSAPEPPLGIMGWIAGYKVVKAIIALVAGIGVLNLQHRDLTEMANKGIKYFDLDPNGRFATDVLAHLLRVNDYKLRLLGAGFFFYSMLYLVEGIGLFLEKRWAEWLTIVATCLLVPLEVYELVRHVTALKIFVLAFNLLMVVYLCWRLKRDDPNELKMLPPS